MPMVAGLYVRRVRTTEVLAAVAAGVAALVALQLVYNGRGVGHLSPPLIGLLASVVASLVAVALTRNAFVRGVNLMQQEDATGRSVRARAARTARRRAAAPSAARSVLPRG